MQIIENFLMGKKENQSLCEDTFFINEHFAAVIDGSTAKTKNTYQGFSTGKNASILLKEVLQNAAKDANHSDILAASNKHLLDFYARENILELTQNNAHERAAASMLVYSKHFHELWFWGDCQALVNGKFYFFEKKIDVVLAEMRAVCLEMAIAEGISMESLAENDLGRAFIQPIIVKGAMFQNQNKSSQYYYEKIDGYGQIEANRIVLEKDDKDIVLASDGYPKIFPTLAESEATLLQIITADPLLFREFKATKAVLKGQHSFDDRCFLRFKV